MPLSDYIQERLVKLNEIDDKLVTTLDNASKMIESLIDMKDPETTLTSEEKELKKKIFQENVIGFNQNLNTSITQLVKEIQLYKVPISVSPNKNVGQDDEKLDSEWASLEKTLNN